MITSEQYAIQTSDGRWLYHLPDPPEHHLTARDSVQADGVPMAPLPSAMGDWWVAYHEADRITARYERKPKITGYRLADLDALSVRYPQTLTPEEFRARIQDDDDYSTHYTLYTAVTEPQDPEEYVYPGPFTALDGEDPPEDGALPWVASLPYSLIKRPEYAHCFPGHIPGLRKHVAAQIKRMVHIQHCFDSYDGRPAGLHITARVPFEQPKTRWVKQYGRSGRELRARKEVPEMVTRELYLPVPDRVSGASYAAAVEDWDRQVAFWVGVARDVAVKACNACGGTGHVPVE